MFGTLATASQAGTVDSLLKAINDLPTAYHVGGVFAVMFFALVAVIPPKASWARVMVLVAAATALIILGIGMSSAGACRAPYRGSGNAERWSQLSLWIEEQAQTPNYGEIRKCEGDVILYADHKSSLSTYLYMAKAYWQEGTTDAARSQLGVLYGDLLTNLKSGSGDYQVRYKPRRLRLLDAMKESLAEMANEKIFGKIAECLTSPCGSTCSSEPFPLCEGLDPSGDELSDKKSQNVEPGHTGLVAKNWEDYREKPNADSSFGRTSLESLSPRR